MKSHQIALAAIVAIFSANASAGIITYSDRSIFNAQGTIVENNNFSSFGGGFGYPGDPYTLGSVTYTSVRNLTVGPGAGYSIGDYQTVITGRRLQVISQVRLACLALMPQ